MKDLLRALRRFIARDIGYILGGLVVVFALWFVLGWELEWSGSLLFALVLLAYPTGLAVATLARLLRPGDTSWTKPGDLACAVYNRFEGLRPGDPRQATVASLVSFDATEAARRLRRARRKYRAEHMAFERARALAKTAGTCGACVLVAAALVTIGRPVFLSVIPLRSTVAGVFIVALGFALLALYCVKQVQALMLLKNASERLGVGSEGTSVVPQVSADGRVAPVPVGSILAYSGAEIPAGWLRCDGNPFDPQENPGLRDALGNLHTPDLRALSPGRAIQWIIRAR